MKKYIYLIQALETGYYKIGISKHPSKRIQELNTGNSSELKLINTYQTDNYSKVETALHNQYSHLKKGGEWFSLSLEDEQSFISNCERIDNGITFLKRNNNVFM